MSEIVREYDPSPVNLATLKRTKHSWIGAGWERLDWPEDEAVAKAIAGGVMFAASRQFDHDGWVAAARAAADRVSAKSVSEASWPA